MQILTSTYLQAVIEFIISRHPDLNSATCILCPMMVCKRRTEVMSTFSHLLTVSEVSRVQGHCLYN